MKASKLAGIAVSTSLIAGLVLTGCGSASSGSDSGKTAITFWAPFSGPDGPFMKSLVDKYDKSQSKYDVKLQIVPQNDYYKTVDLAFNGQKTRPDLLIMHLDQIPTYVSKGLLQPVDQLAQKAGITKDDYAKASWNYDTFNGKLYAMPLDIHPLIMYYNKDLFKAAGITNPPTNRQEFLDDVKKLTVPSKGQYGYVVPTLWPQQFIFPTILFQNGGQLMDNQGHIAYNSKAGVEALQFMKSLIDKHYSPANVQQDGEITLFLQGKNAIDLNGPWMKDQWDKAHINYGVAPVPQLGTVKQAVFGNGHNFVVPKAETDKTKLAGIADFLKFATANSIDWAKSGQAVASNKVRATEAFKKLTQQPIVAKEFDYVQFSPKVANWGSISDPLWKEINMALLGQKSPQQALDDAAKESRQAMGK
ncbi:ABC transporter substrate-binding protein [Fodinisporobacter ferrooxydans]|uniref:ABC transporter substrate-binding protein n=1 Tax=Fodinisporobacter ferrooxydans TaxID=2901836 RepID=A0ABY4CJF5_9BACL|nr:ABC transporter substrate-binding protein [Alicyclobacillaceae bacterium MYW30-H2]